MCRNADVQSPLGGNPSARCDGGRQNHRMLCVFCATGPKRVGDWSAGRKCVSPGTPRVLGVEGRTGLGRDGWISRLCHTKKPRAQDGPFCFALRRNPTRMESDRRGPAKRGKNPAVAASAEESSSLTTLRHKMMAVTMRCESKSGRAVKGGCNGTVDTQYPISTTHASALGW